MFVMHMSLIEAVEIAIATLIGIYFFYLYVSHKISKKFGKNKGKK